MHNNNNHLPSDGIAAHEAAAIAAMHAQTAPDLEYTPICERLPELVRASEVADLRARVTELERLLSAVPVDELRRWLEYSSVFNAIIEGRYGKDEARADFAQLTVWLDAAKAPTP